MVIGIIVAAVLLLFGVLLGCAAIIGAALFVRNLGLPKMAGWEKRLVTKSVNEHKRRIAADAAMRTVVEAAGYEPHDE